MTGEVGSGLLKSLRHENIIRFLFLVMELACKGALGDRMPQQAACRGRPGPQLVRRCLQYITAMRMLSW